MISKNHIQNCTNILMKFQEKYFTKFRFYDHKKPNIQMFLNLWPIGHRPHLSILCSLFYFENYNEEGIRFKKTKLEMKVFVITCLEKIEFEIRQKVKNGKNN